MLLDSMTIQLDSIGKEKAKEPRSMLTQVGVEGALEMVEAHEEIGLPSPGLFAIAAPAVRTRPVGD